MTDYTLAAAAGVLALLGGSTDGNSRADAGFFALIGAEVTFARGFNVDLGSLTLKLDPLKKQQKYWNEDGTPTVLGQLHDQRQREAIEKAFNRLVASVAAIQAAYDAAAQASAAASEAKSAAVEVREEVAGVVETVTAIEAGTFNFPAITIGGEKFVNAGDGGGLKPAVEAAI